MAHSRTKEIAAAKREPFAGDLEPSELSALFQELEMEIGLAQHGRFFDQAANLQPAVRN